MEGAVSILLRFMSMRSRPGAVRGAPLRTGGRLAGRLAGWLVPWVAEVTVGCGSRRVTPRPSREEGGGGLPGLPGGYRADVP